MSITNANRNGLDHCVSTSLNELIAATNPVEPTCFGSSGERMIHAATSRESATEKRVINDFANRAMVPYEEFIAAGTFDLIQPSEMDDSILQSFPVSPFITAAAVQRNAGHAVAMWVTFYPAPRSPKAPYFRLQRFNRPRQTSRAAQAACATNPAGMPA